MCGIIGYLGEKNTATVLTEGLKRLEYRGYDSAGIAVFHDDCIQIRRTEGKLAILQEMISKESFNGHTGRAGLLMASLRTGMRIPTKQAGWLLFTMALSRTIST